MLNKSTSRSKYVVQSGVTQYPVGFEFFFNGDDTPQIRVTIGAMVAEENLHFVISEDLLTINLIPLEEEAPVDPNDYSWMDKWVGAELVIERDIPFVQESDYQLGRISPERIEKDFDLSVMRDQILAGQIKEHTDDVQGEIDALNSRIDFVQEEHALDMVAVDESLATKATKAELENAKTTLYVGIQGNAQAIQKTRDDMNAKDSQLETILNDHTNRLDTLRTDHDDLGNQVAGIESKIPESASETNPLVTKGDLADGYVKKSGDTMTGDLAFNVVAGGYTVTFQDSYANVDTGNTDSVIKRITSPHQTQGLIFSEHKNGTVDMQFTMIADGFFMPRGNRLLGSTDYPWNNIYTKKLNNGADLAIPTDGGTLARLEDLAESLEIVAVDQLPETGEKGILYLVKKDGVAPDIHDEYVWIESTQAFELIGTTQVDLTGYAKKDYVDSADRQLKANQDSLYTNQVVLRNMLNTKDADGNWTTLTTTAQAAIPAINELNDSKASNEELSGYLPLSGGTMTGSIIRVREDGDASDPILRTFVSDKSYYISATSYGYYFSGAGVFFNGVRPHDVAGADLGTWVYKWRTVYTTKISSGLDMDIEVPEKKGTMALVEDINAIGGEGTAGQVLTKTDDGMAWQDAAGGGASLPDQTGNAGKFLTTDGADVSWGGENLVQDNATFKGNGLAIGTRAQATASSTTAYGTGSNANGQGATAIGSNSKALNYATAVGNGAKADAARAVQLGYGTNTDASTFKVANANGNFEMMDADGNVPLDRLTYVTNQIGDISTALTAILGE